MEQIITPFNRVNRLIQHVDKEILRKICQKYHIVSLELFGSILTENFNETSDIDMLVKFNPKHIPSFFKLFEIQEKLVELFQRKVDLRTKYELSKYFRQEVIDKAVLIYEN